MASRKDYTLAHFGSLVLLLLYVLFSFSHSAKAQAHRRTPASFSSLRSAGIFIADTSQLRPS